MSKSSEKSPTTNKVDKNAEAEALKKKVLEIQQNFYENLGDRHFDYLRPDQSRELELKIGYALFGNLIVDDEDAPYSTENTKEIKKICEFIYKISENKHVYIAFLFIVGGTKKEIYSNPVFKILVPHENTVFLDRHLRLYNTWKQFIRNNKLPPGNYGYPKDGVYQGDENDNVLLTFHNNWCSKFLNASDKITSYTSVGAVILSAAMPAGATIAIGAGVACGIYGCVRGGCALYDRSKHKQTISVMDEEGRKCWLSTIGSGVGAAGGLGTTGIVYLTTKGKEIGKIGQFAVNLMNGSSLFIQGVGVAEDGWNLIMKFKNDKLTKRDCIEFSVSFLFFANIAVNAKTAETIIKQTQSEYLSNFTAEISKKRRQSFNEIVKNSGGDGSIQSNARLIKAIENADSKDDFFRKLMRSLKQRYDTFVNKADGKSYKSNINNNSCKLSVKYTPILKDITKAKVKEIHNCLHNGVIQLSDNKLIELTDNFKGKIAKEFARYFGSSDSRLSETIRQSEKLAKDRECATEEDYITFLRFLIIYKQLRLKEMEKVYEEQKRIKKELMGDDFDESIFDNEQGIQNSYNKRQWFQNIIEKEIEESNEHLKETYDFCIEEITALNQDGHLTFRSNLHAMNEYFHSFVIDGQEILPRDFFEIIRKVTDKKSVEGELIVCDDGIIYSDTTIPVHVKVVEDEKGKFLKSVSFVSIEMLYV